MYFDIILGTKYQFQYLVHDLISMQCSRNNQKLEINKYAYRSIGMYEKQCRVKFDFSLNS